VTKLIEATVDIKAAPSAVWKVLTEPHLMKEWMGEPEMSLDIRTDWKVNNPITIAGFHHVKFEIKGTILKYDINKTLTYTHLSSISHLPDKRENYTLFEFKLKSVENKTELSIEVSNFPTESHYQHFNLYWKPTLKLIKRIAEGEVI